MKKSTLIPALALVAAMLAHGCSRSANQGAAPGAPVLVAQAVETNLPVQIDPPPVGHVMPYSTVTIHSQIQGMISEVHFQEGQEVKKATCCSRLTRARRRRRWTRRARRWNATRRSWNTRKSILRASKNCSIKN